ncbi:MAG: molybdenum cofactor guanylyltransferase [Actinomycetota bacterium]|nr:molybdenum cofactor guanylyltransferase [Actinomycetota bacterium]
MKPAHVHGLLLTGGSSSRMGRDKASLDVGGIPIGLRAAAALAAVADPVLIVGNDIGGGYEVVDDARRGPLAAFAAGAAALRARGHDGAILLLACDMPFVDAELLASIASAIGKADGAIPVAGDRDQPLAACYSVRAAVTAQKLVAGGHSAMRDLIGALRVHRVEIDETALMDVDTPQDLAVARRVRHPRQSGLL